MRVVGPLMVCGVLLLACSEAAPPRPAVTEVPLAKSLDEVMRRSHFAFWPEGDGFTGGHDTYEARVDARGIAVTPAAGDTALQLGLAQVHRGGREAKGARRLQRRADGLLERVGADAVEVLENTEGGLEQSWRFDAQPSGDGALVVRVPVAGFTRVVTTASGLHFALGAGFVRYGHGTWVDADGARTPVPASVSGGAVELRVPAEVLARSRYPAVLDPLITPEQDVEEPLLVAAVSNQGPPAVAFNGSLFLVAWPDSRATTSQVMAARVQGDGTILDPVGFPLGLAPHSTSAPPGIAAGGGLFLVTGQSPTDTTPRAVRVDASGAVLDSPALALSTVYSATSAVAWSGSAWLVLTAEPVGTGAEVFGRTVSLAGDVSARVVMTNIGGYDINATPTFIALAVGGGTVLVLYRDSYAVRMTRFTPELLPLVAVPAILPLSNSSSQLGVGWDGQRFVLAWRASVGTLRLARVTTAGVIVDGPTVVGQGSASTVALHTDATGALLTWTEARVGVAGLYGTRVTPTGAIEEPSGRLLATLSGANVRLASAAGATSQLVAWNGNNDVLALRVSASGAPLDAEPVLLSRAPPRQSQPSLAWNGTHYLASWLDLRGNTSGVYVNRLRRDGTPVTPLATRLSASAPSQERPVIASDGRGWLLTWSQGGDGTDVMGARVDATGASLDDAGLRIAAGPGNQSSPAIAWLGDRYLVTYLEGSSGSRDVRAVLVDPASPLAGTNLLVSDAPGDQYALSVAALDGGAFVAWVDRRDGGYNVVGARVGGGQVLDPAGLRLADSPQQEINPCVAAAPDQYLVGWEERLPISGDTRVEAARVTPAGLVLDDAGLVLSDRLPVVTLPVPCQATWDGDRYVVAWGQRTSASAPATLHGTWVDLGGLAAFDGGLALSPDDAGSSPMAAALASQGHRQALLAFATPPLADAGFINRVRTRLLTRGEAPAAQGATATTPEDVAVEVPLTGTDPDADPLTFVVVAAPDAGLAVATDAGVRFTPPPDFFGDAVFSVAADDGALLSPPVEVRVTVAPVDDAPRAEDLALATDEEVEVSVPLPTRDVDGEALQLELVAAPAHGTVSGQPPSVRYAPAADFVGDDVFTYALRDAANRSGVATVTVTVRGVDDGPRASSADVTLEEDSTADVELQGVEVDGDALRFTVTRPPQQGVLSGAAPRLRYAPRRDWSGEDTLEFEVSDGTRTAAGTVRLLVTPVNDAPTAAEQTLEARAGVPVAVTLSGADPDGEPLSFSVTSGPAEGELGGAAPALTYTARSDFAGEDALVFRVTDGAGATAEATVRFTVRGARPTPTGCGCATAGAPPLAWLLLLAAVTGRSRRGSWCPRGR